MAANFRGDVAFEIDGTEHVITPTWDALVMIERVTGKGLLEAYTAVQNFHMTTIAQVLHCGLIGGGMRSVQLPAVGQAVMLSLAKPDNPLRQAALDFLNAFAMEEDGEKKPEASPTTPKARKGTGSTRS